MSNQKSDFDVIIVGAGPSGSTSGYVLSDNGLRVLIIDKEVFPRQKLCGGLLTLKTLRLLQSIFNETENSLKEKHILNYDSDCYEVFFRNRRLAKNSVNIPFYFVNREVYDHFLLSKAKNAGADILEGERVTSINQLTNEVKTSTGKTFKAKYIIGADGVNSKVRQEVFTKNSNSKMWQKNLAMGLEIVIDRKKLERQIDHPIIYFGYVNCGYSWIFPNKERIIVGMGGLNRKNKKGVAKSFYSFLSSLGLPVQQNSRAKGHLVPYGNFLMEPIQGRILLVGDAGGFVDPIFGEGIFYAQETAFLASIAILQNEFGKKELQRSYLDMLQRYVYPELIYAKKLRPIIFNAFDMYSQGRAMQLLLNMFGKQLIEIIHGERSYRLF